ncbi:MAG: T9SS type A sorting domain-containing protein, partial [Ignavibacteriaceae bacterium]|nr:T9SS type A sorting domain-containing protein [Ignavibacteriaceae bacterium]
PTPILGSAASGIKLPNGAWRFIISSGYSSSGPTAITDIYFNNNNVTSVKSEQTTVSSYRLEQNYPNPFNPSTIIRYSIPQDGYVKLSVYNILGKEVSTLVNNWQRSGSYSVMFNARNLSSSVYFYKLESGTFSSVKKLILIK